MDPARTDGFGPRCRRGPPRCSCRGSCRSGRTRSCSRRRGCETRWCGGWRPWLRPARAADRLRRLLVIVPYVIRHLGVELAELSRLFDVSEQDLTSDLDLVFMSGLPPYGPGDLIDVQIEDGRVRITMADYFARPLRLTRTEALSLYLRGK